MKFVQNNWTVPQRGSLWILSVVYNFPHYLGYPLCIILDHHFTWWHQKMGGDVPLLVFPSAGGQGNPWNFWHPKKSSWKHTSLVPNSKSGSNGCGKLLAWDTKLIFTRAWFSTSGRLWVVKSTDPTPTPSQPIPTHLISFLALGLAFNWRSKYKVPKAEVTMTPTMAANSGSVQGKVKGKEGFRLGWFLPSLSGGFFETTQNGKICPR